MTITGAKVSHKLKHTAICCKTGKPGSSVMVSKSTAGPAANSGRAETDGRYLALWTPRQRCRTLIPVATICVRGSCGYAVRSARFQDAGGLWHTVINADTYLESTLAAMVAYAATKAFDAGCLDPAEFGGMEQKARRAVTELIAADGSLERVSEATPVSEFRMYATRPFGVFPWGQGPLLLMLSQK